MNAILVTLSILAAIVAVKWFIDHVLCLTMTNATAAVTASKLSSAYGTGGMGRRGLEDVDAAAGTLYNGILVGKDSTGAIVPADDTAELTDIGAYVGQLTEVDSSKADGDSEAEVLRGVVCEFLIATLGTEAAARRAHGKTAYVRYSNEVALTPGTYGNVAGTIINHTSLTLVQVFIPLAPDVNAFMGDTTTQIWVDAANGSDVRGDGSRGAPKRTIEAAFALKSATRNTMFILPGTYLPAATMTLPAYNFSFIGIGGPEQVIIGGSAAAAHLFTRAAGALTATTTFTWKDLDLYHGDTYAGIYVDNTTAGKKIILSLKNVECEGAGRPIHVHTHGDASNAVRIYADAQENEWEGEVSFAVGNDGDIIQIKNCVLSGGFITNTSATVMRISLHNCLIPATHTTGGASQQVCNVKNCHTLSGANETKAVAADIGGSQTVRIVTGVAA